MTSTSDMINNYTKSYFEEVIDSLRLIRTENIGIKTFFSLIKMFGSAKIALENVKDMSLKGGRRIPISIYSKQAAYEEVEYLESIGGRFLLYSDEKYPKILKYIPDPPPILSVAGNINLLNSQCIAVVGTRNCSLAGKTFAKSITTDLTRYGYTIVSGLARGIDTAVHEASLPNTIAVLPGGLDYIYPFENRKLYYKIIEKGLVISESAPKLQPTNRHFPKRNRIISGLSLGIVVIEANLNSGSLITAKQGLEQNREIFAVPGFPMDPRSEGTNQLIKLGAYVVDSVQDIISNLPKMNKIKPTNDYSLKEENEDEALTPHVEVTNTLRQRTLELLSSNPVSLDQLHNELHIPLQVLYVIILELELAGKISRHPGNKVALIY